MYRPYLRIFFKAPMSPPRFLSSSFAFFRPFCLAFRAASSGGDREDLDTSPSRLLLGLSLSPSAFRWLLSCRECPVLPPRGASECRWARMLDSPAAAASSRIDDEERPGARTTPSALRSKNFFSGSSVSGSTGCRSFGGSGRGRWLWCLEERWPDGSLTS